ncbi:MULTISPECIES: 6-carboxytetrahydropterin synthase [Aeromonas]|uniref:6-carboxy-5,6,7,8-tetrahydropterin synthase n=1 Tax=Aeromonas caviae TaxID=648 RepID=A0AAV4YGF7_AERCA|nr:MULTISPECIES: 6-carboxytetrahydropterin synthase [Aeromonas]MCR3984445.1 6-carboxytetrahydropterin synthase [Aeromonas caviae]MDM5111218.1 6-carboxytetrahydropterin synthase [Aeromonas caviae]MDX7919449.1 6-carboxytetrahydropterin synthase [Aeromonas caviae]MEA9436854.1 6-carboxytetrahydropterin synthase [Aeromonas caviae]UDN28463.1 6-carboxytetrahydropterin synthase [Aeromonas caviae]
MKLFVRDLTVIDSSYLCERRGMVGESWLVDIEMSGELNEMSMLLDFGRVKKLIKSIIDEEVDHKLLVPTECPLVHVHALENDESTVDLLRPGRAIHLRCPTQGFAFIPAPQVDKESVTRYLLGVLAKRLPSNIKDLSLTLRSERIEGAFYHYSHGLKKHDGNCQRIAHGHRSPVEILVDGERDEELEFNWAERWADIYLGTEEDRVALGELALSERAEASLKEGDAHYIGFKYVAPQGLFQLAMPAAEVEMIDTDTTIELLAHYIAREVKKQVGDKFVKIVAYEGVGKGAIAYA